MININRIICIEQQYLKALNCVQTNKFWLVLKIMLPTKYSFTKHLYVYMQDLAFNNPEGLICHKIQTNQTIVLSSILHSSDLLLSKGLPPDLVLIFAFFPPHFPSFSFFIFFWRFFFQCFFYLFYIFCI